MNKFGVGQPVTRVEDQRFVSGRGCYTDDVTLPRQAYGVVVTSPHAHARVRRVEAGRALAAPGVLCVLSGAECFAEGLAGLGPLFMPEDMPATPHRVWRAINSAKAR